MEGSQLLKTEMALPLSLMFVLPTAMDLSSLSADGRCGEIFHRNGQEEGIWNHPDFGPDFGVGDLVISKRDDSLSNIQE
jgi:hypothetical protein